MQHISYYQSQPKFKRKEKKTFRKQFSRASLHKVGSEDQLSHPMGAAESRAPSQTSDSPDPHISSLRSSSLGQTNKRNFPL